jgi:diguanylate cyclase (GGDEF)-like protein/PAS domain S-box-containing protein
MNLLIGGDRKMDDLLTSFDSKLFDTLSESANRVFFYYADIKNFVSRWSKSAVEYFGLPSEILNPASIWDDKVHPDDMAVYQKSFSDMMTHVTPYHNCEYRITNSDGEYVWVNCRGYMTYDDDGTPSFFAGFVTNMGMTTKIDPVTGLWTKYSFRDDVTRILETGKSGAAMYIDVRNFKRVNSKYGYDFGDMVLHKIGQIISNACGTNGKIYRIEGKQYSIIIENGTKEDIIKIKDKITEQTEEMLINGQILHIDISYGATLFPQDGQFADQIQSNLTYALSTAKQSNTKDVVFYTNELFEQRNRITRLTDALRDSIVNNFEGFRLVMQPIIDAKTEKVYSAEALLRWSNDEFQNVSPMEFIPILEQTGDIIPVGKWILDRALKYLAEWNKINAHNKLNHININFSYIQFTDESLKNYIIDELNKYELPHNSLIIELTESCRIEYTDKLAHLLQNFRDDGITIALDDFGTGYASLRLLRDLPADIVKIDHTMMRTIVNTPRDRTLVEFIITYCSKMNIEVCAEGVETGETLKIVKSADAKYIQGYYYDKPLETDEFFNKYIA